MSKHWKRDMDIAQVVGLSRLLDAARKAIVDGKSRGRSTQPPRVDIRSKSAMARARPFFK
jgi:hypothetical protein